MSRFVALLVLLSATAFAQTPNGFVQFQDPPEAYGADYTLYYRHMLWNLGKSCLQRSTPTGWQCLTTSSETDAARQAAVSQAASSAAATYMPTATANAAIATMNGRIDSVQASITPDSVCGNTSIASNIVVPALGLSTVYTTTIAGAVAGSPCTVGMTAYPPLGGTARCIASAANTVQLRFEGALLTFPAGTYRQCVQIRP